MSTPEQPALFEPYDCSLGTVIGHDSNAYRIATPDGRTIGITANGEPSEANVEADIANPPAPVVAPRKQTARVVLGRLTDAEYTALTTSPVVAIQRALETARIEAVISEADPDFAAFVAGCDALGIIAANRWDALLAP